VSDVLVDRDDAIAVVTLNRPAKRNSLTAEMMALFNESISDLDRDEGVRCIVLTGSDPAFCAGLDLRNLSTSLRGSGAPDGSREPAPRGLIPRHDTPIIGAINGAAVTGGLEVALGCDFLIASERAAFADTHARVGVIPAGGVTIRLPQLIGIDRARRMSLTGDFVDAATALSWGLVTQVVAHDELLDVAREVARSISAIDPEALTTMRRLYEDVDALSGDDAFAFERAANRTWMREKFNAGAVDARVSSIIERGSQQL